MKWVLLFFCSILGIIFLTFLLLVFSTIKLQIEKLDISNIENGIKKKFEKEIKIFLDIYLGGKIRVARIKLDDKKVGNIRKRFNLKELRKSSKQISKGDIFDILRAIQIKIERANLNAQIGTEDAILTIFAVTFLSTIFRSTI